MDRYQKRVLKLREHVLSHNKNNSEVEQPIKEDSGTTNVIAYEDMTKADIVELLAKRGIEHNPRHKKETLIDLLLGSD